MTSTVQEAAVLESILPQLEADGYEVYLHPSRHLLPHFMRDYPPDAIAVRDDSKLAIEVLREGPTSKERLSRFERLLARQKDWELRVYWLTPATAPKTLSIESLQTIQEAIGTVKELISKDLRGPALLMGWASFEALGRALSPSQFARPQTPGRLVEMLAANGELTPTEADLLRSLAEARNQLVHGGLTRRISKKELKGFMTILETLLNSLRTAANAKDVG